VARELFRTEDGDYITTPWGAVVFHNNGLHIHTDRPDPAELSFIGAVNCKVSWKDSEGREKVLLQLRENAKGDGEFYFGGLSMERYVAETAHGNPKALDAAMIELATINPDVEEVRVPIKFSGGVATQPTTQYPTGSYDGSEFVGSEGKFRYARQQDGHDVLYNANGVAIWTSDGGVDGTWLATS
jgi:hypothetical protein